MSIFADLTFAQTTYLVIAGCILLGAVAALVVCAIRQDESAIDPGNWTFSTDGYTFPFVEDDWANITGLGHQDKAGFAAAINLYDEVCNGEAYPEDEQWAAAHITHKYAVYDENPEPFLRATVGGQRVTPKTPGAVPITTMWGQR